MYDWYAATASFLKAHHALLYDDDERSQQKIAAIEQGALSSLQPYSTLLSIWSCKVAFIAR